MSETSFSTSVGEWLRAAHAGDAGCPDPGLYLEEAEGRLTPADGEALAAHAAGCPACAAERELARSFAAADEAEVAAADLGFVVDRLRQGSPVAAKAPAPPMGKVVPFPGVAGGSGAPVHSAAPAPRRPAAAPASHPAFWRLAAALFFVLAAGLALRFWGRVESPLPPPEIGGVVRGAEIEGLAPAGEVAALPAELAWEPYPGAASYRVQVTAVDGAVLWQGTVAAPPARLPAELSGRLHRAVRYTWKVTALAQDGAEIAAAEPVSFTARPAP